MRSEKPIIFYTLHPVSQKFPQRCLWNASNVRLIDDDPLSSFQGRSCRVSSLNASLLQAINGVMSLASCPHVVSQASQHFRSSEKQATCEGCFALQSICSVVSLHSGMSRAVHPQEFSNVDVDQSGLPIPLFSFSVASSLTACEDDSMCGLTVTSWDNPADGMGDCSTSIVKLEVETV